MEGPCEIARIRKDVTAKTFDFLQSEIADDVSLSKLGLAAAWKSESQEIERKVANGTITQRPYAMSLISAIAPHGTLSKGRATTRRGARPGRG